MTKHAGGRPRTVRITHQSRTIRRTEDDDARLARLQARYPDQSDSDLYRDGLRTLELGGQARIDQLEHTLMIQQRHIFHLLSMSRAMLDDLTAMGIETASSHALRKLIEEPKP